LRYLIAAYSRGVVATGKDVLAVWGDFDALTGGGKLKVLKEFHPTLVLLVLSEGTFLLI
jgi:hypothetical protein